MATASATKAIDRDMSDPAASARAAGLRYVLDTTPGIRRWRIGKNFSYVKPDGSLVRDDETLGRIRSLAIPPAWNDVWICPDPRGHIQATGRDAKGRKQFRYHPQWKIVRDAVKYDRMIEFAEGLPRIREHTDRDLALPGTPREKVLATVVQLLETTLIRVGNEEYRRRNESFGLTTLRDRHVDVSGSTLKFHFRGKGGKEYSVSVTNRRLARVVHRCQEIPGHELFQHTDEGGHRHAIESGDVNSYLREISQRRSRRCWTCCARGYRAWRRRQRREKVPFGCSTSYRSAKGARRAPLRRARPTGVERTGTTRRSEAKPR